MINYYTYSAESKTLAKASRVIVRDGKTIILGQPEDFARYLNAYPAAAYEPPTPIEGKTAVPNGYELRNGEWHQTWDYIDNPPPPPRVFVTADLVEALMAEGVWEQARAWIVERGMLDLVLATAEFTEDNENFQAGKTALQSALGWTDEEVEELLAKCVKEGV